VAAALLAGAPNAWAYDELALPKCCPVDEIATGGSVYVLDLQAPEEGSERATLVRVDPTTTTITGQLTLPTGTPTGNSVNTEPMTVAAGSIWITAFFHDEVLRIDPHTMLVDARIRVGRAPAGIVSDGSSVWVLVQEDGVLARIDPATNAVVQTVHVGDRGGADDPYQLAWNGTQLLVSLPGTGRVARVDPDRGRVVGYDAVGYDAAACARVLPAPGGYWLDDTECAFTYYRWDDAAGAITAQVDPEPRHDFGSVVVGKALYTGEFTCTDTGCTAFLYKYDAVTGAKLARRHTGDDALLPHFAAGTFWVGHWGDGTVVRLARF
jgi:streptogramin lyase